MTSLQPNDLAKFVRDFRFTGASLRLVRTVYRKGQLNLDVVVMLRPSIKNLGEDAKPTKLHLKLTGVEEFRMQKRPNSAAGRVGDARFGYFQTLFYVNFDAWPLEPGEQLGVHDFRASDAYVACQRLEWAIMKPKASD